MHAILDLLKFSKALYDRHLVHGSGGNTSVRVGETAWITQTGSVLGELTQADLSEVALDGQVLSGGAPSKELGMHLAMYRLRPEVLAIIHVHPTHAIAYSPMYCGLLTGAMTRERVAGLPDDDWRKRDVDFTEPNLSKNLGLVERLKAVGDKYRRSTGEVAIAWTLHNPAVTGSIVGVRSAKQAEGVMCAGDLLLSEKDFTLLEVD